MLGGRQGEGLVGITFAIKGKLDDPSVLVNPMSVMTPGIFRQIFEFTGTVPDTAAATRPGSPADGFRRRRNRHLQAYTGRISAWRFLPSESLITPSGVRSARVSSRFSSVTASSFTLMPPPLIWRLASPVDETKPTCMLAVSTPSPSRARARGISKVGRLDAIAPSSNVARAVSAARSAASRPCTQRCRLGGEHLLRLVQLGALELRELADLVKGKLGEQLEETRHVGVLAVPPILPIVVRGEHVGVEPHRARCGLSHLGAGGGGEQGRGQPEQLDAVGAPPKLDAADDIAPLIGAAHLQAAAEPAVKLDEIVGLQHHVVELDEAQGLLALEPQLHRILGEHAVDAEMASVIAQEIDIAELVEPIGVVDHDGVVGAVAEAHELA